MTTSRLAIENSRVGEITIFTTGDTRILTIGRPGAQYSIHFTREEFREFVKAADSVIPLGYRYPDDNAQEPTHSLKAKGVSSFDGALSEQAYQYGDSFGWSVTAC